MNTFPSPSVSPAVLPYPTPGFAGNNASSVIRTQMETGRYRQRRRFSRENRMYNATWLMTDFEFGMFQSWVLYKINDGADYFYIDLPTGGDSYKTVVARIVDGKYEFDHNQDSVLHWNVKATLEVEDALVWSEEDYDALAEIGDISLLESAAADISTFVST